MSAHAFGARTTLRVGGEATEFYEVLSRDQLAALAGPHLGSRALYVLGNGSNTLVADAGFDGVVIHLAGEFEAVTIDGTRITAGGAADLPVIARQSVAAGLTGFEWAVGVPGTMGGAVAMNAGGHGSDMAASIVEVRILNLVTGEVVSRSNAEMAFSYRRSSVNADELVLSATIELEEGDAAGSAERLKEIVRWRRANQPGGPNCGSVFANPPGDSAGRLIEAAAKRGVRHGTAAVSAKHANFIQADPEGAADDVVALMLEVADAVEALNGVRLHAEVRLVGVDPEIRRRLTGQE